MAYIPYNTGQFNPIPPELEAGQTAPLQIDSLGNLKTTTSILDPAFIFMEAMLRELKSIRMILAISMAESGQAKEADFDPDNFTPGIENVEIES